MKKSCWTQRRRQMHATERPMPFSHAGSHSFPLVTVNLGWLMMSTELESTQSSTPHVLSITSPPCSRIPTLWYARWFFLERGKENSGPTFCQSSAVVLSLGGCAILCVLSAAAAAPPPSRSPYGITTISAYSVLSCTLRSRAESDEIGWGCVIGRLPSKDLAPGLVETKSRRLVECKCPEVTPIHSLEKVSGRKKKG